MNQTEDNDGVTVFPPAVFLGGLVLGYLVWWFWPVPIIPAEWSIAVRVVGGMATALGLWVMFLALSQFRRLGTTPTHWEPTTTLAFDGPYRFTRNPMYVGMALVQGGLALLGNALWPLLALVPVIAIIRTQVIAREEAYLEAKFGASYRDFKARVRRWI